MSSQNNYKFLLMWDCYGLEYIYDLGDWERRKVWDILKEQKTVDNPAPLTALILRARYNPQRHYEIYILETVDVDKDTIVQCFKDNPQSIVDLIRTRGVKIHSDRASQRTKEVIV